MFFKYGIDERIGLGVLSLNYFAMSDPGGAGHIRSRFSVKRKMLEVYYYLIYVRDHPIDGR